MPGLAALTRRQVQQQIDTVVASEASVGLTADIHWHLLPEAAAR